MRGPSAGEKKSKKQKPTCILVNQSFKMAKSFFACALATTFIAYMILRGSVEEQRAP